MLLFNRKIIKLITVGIVTNDYFKKLTKRIKSDNRTFEIIRVGCLRYVYYNETRIMKMYVLRSDKNVAGIHLVRMVHQDVINKLKEGEYTIKSTSTVEEAKLYTFFNPKGVENCINNYGSNLIMIDINKCYWNTISIIGAITQNTYNKGMEKQDEWKDAMNIAIGSLAKKITSFKYITGNLVGLPSIEESPLALVRMDIINYVYDISKRLALLLGDKFCLFYTDCFYVVNDAKTINKVNEYLQIFGYTSKKNSEIIKSVKMERGKTIIELSEHNKSFKTNQLM